MKTKNKMLIGLGVLVAGITIYLITRKKDDEKSNFIAVKNKGGSGTTKSLYE